MTYQTIQEYNATGLDGIFVYLANAVPLFIPMMLAAIFFLITLSVYFGTKKYGTGDFFAAATAGGLVTSIIATIMTFTAGMVNLPVLMICIAVTILFFIGMMAKRERD